MGKGGFDLVGEVSIFSGAVCEASEAHPLSPVLTPLECLCEPSYPTRMPSGSPDTVSWQLQAIRSSPGFWSGCREPEVGIWMTRGAYGQVDLFGYARDLGSITPTIHHASTKRLKATPLLG